jgi:hypothetical protein
MLENDMLIDFYGVLGGTETVSVLLFFVFALVNPSGFAFCCFFGFLLSGSSLLVC